jgi:formylglycine-generating enzyme required for sulfatase activity
MENNPSLFRDPHRPVERVTWYDADEFCRRVTEEERAAGRLPEGYIYRLPTSREFDAMRNTDPRLPVMLSDDRVIRWHTSRVGSSPPNQVRLHDVIGNVWEWSLDWWDRDERFKISLGGAWWNRAGQLQFTDKDLRDVNPLLQNWIKRLISPFRRDYPDQAYWDRGFRVVLARPASPQQEWPIDREPWRQKR